MAVMANQGSLNEQQQKSWDEWSLEDGGGVGIHTRWVFSFIYNQAQLIHTYATAAFPKGFLILNLPWEDCFGFKDTEPPSRFTSPTVLLDLDLS